MNYSEQYKDPKLSGAFGGINFFLKNQKPIKTKEARRQIANTPVYSKFVPARRRFQRRAFIFHYIDYVWVIDLKILDKFRNLRDNKRKSSILMCLDGFSKYLFTKPLRNKTGPEVAKAFEDILLESGRTPKYVFSDYGKEFISKQFQSVLSKYNIKYYNTHTTMKASP